MVTNFNAKTLLLGAGVAEIAAGCYFFIDRDKEEDKRHEAYLSDLRNGTEKLDADFDKLTKRF